MYKIEDDVSLYICNILFRNIHFQCIALNNSFMERKVFIPVVLLLLFTSFAAYSQFDRKRASISLTLGYDQSTVTNDMGRGTARDAIYGGVLLNWKWTDYVSLQPGLLLVPKGYDSYQMASNGAHFDYKVRAYYLEIPLTAVFSIPLARNLRLQIDPGLYYSYGMFGKIKMDMIRWERICEIFGKERDIEQWMRNDTGWMVGVGLEFFDRLVVRAHYEQGFVKLVTNDDLERRNKMWGISLSYKIY